MAFDVRTGQMVYNADDLIGLARIGAFGPKSELVYAALNQLKMLQARNVVLEKELVELRESVSNIIQVQSSISEISTTSLTPEKKNTKSPKK